MTHRVTARTLARDSARVLDLVAAGQSVEVTRNGQLAAVLSPPPAEYRQLEHLAGMGLVDLDKALRVPAARDIDWSALPDPGVPEGQLSRALEELRAAEER